MNYRSHIGWQGLSKSYRLHVGWQELSTSYLILWQILLILQPTCEYIYLPVLHTFSFLIAFIFWNIFRFSKIFVRDPHLLSIFWTSFTMQNFCLPDDTLQCAIERWCVASGHQAKHNGRQRSLNLYGSWHISPTSSIRFVPGRQEAHLGRLTTQPDRSDAQDTNMCIFNQK